MKRTKEFLLLSFLLIIVTISQAQPEFTAEAAQLFTTFKFKDSQGLSHNGEYESLITGGYGIGMRYVTEGGIFFRAGVGMRKGGANLVYDNVNYAWRLHYLDLKLGAGYMAQFKYVKPYITVSGYYAPLLRGIQTLNNEDLNIKKSSVLNNQDLGLQFNPGINFRISSYMSGYIELNYLLGLSNLELNKTQTSKNVAYGANIGFAFLLTEKNN